MNGQLSLKSITSAINADGSSIYAYIPSIMLREAKAKVLPKL
jgi:hypothetical protein